MSSTWRTAKATVEETNKSEIVEEKEVPLTGKRIMIANDNMLSRLTAKHGPSKYGAEVVLCEGGEDAFELVCKYLRDLQGDDSSRYSVPPFDCILMDCEMPKMNGAEATWRIREAEKRYGCNICSQIFAFTAHEKGEEVDNMIRAGVDGYITKPLNQEKLFKALSIATKN